jgi:hypothetical protein
MSRGWGLAMQEPRIASALACDWIRPRLIHRGSGRSEDAIHRPAARNQAAVVSPRRAEPWTGSATHSEQRHRWIGPFGAGTLRTLNGRWNGGSSDAVCVRRNAIVVPPSADGLVADSRFRFLLEMLHCWASGEIADRPHGQPSLRDKVGGGRMPHHRRCRVSGGTYSLTINLLERARACCAVAPLSAASRI